MSNKEKIQALREALQEAYGTETGYMKFYTEQLKNEIKK